MFTRGRMAARMAKLLVLCCQVGNLLPSRVSAQVANEAKPQEDGRLLCIRPGAPGRCGAFPVFDVTLSSAEFGEQDAAAGHLQWGVGLMVNTWSSYSIGATVLMGQQAVGHWGGQLRVRRWFGPRAAIEIAPGVARVGRLAGEWNRATIDVGVVLDGWLGLGAHAGHDRHGFSRGMTVTIGSLPGVVVGLLAYTVLALPST